MNRVFSIFVSDMQKKVSSHIVNFDGVCRNINMLVMAEKNTKNIHNVYFGELLPDKLGNTHEIITKFDHPVIKKEYYSMFSGELDKRLRKTNVTDVILSGVETQWCVAQTAFDLLNSGYTVHIPIDATSSHSKVEHDIAVERMKQYGVKICSTKGIINELLVEPRRSVWYVDYLKRMRLQNRN